MAVRGGFHNVTVTRPITVSGIFFCREAWHSLSEIHRVSVIFAYSKQMMSYETIILHQGKEILGFVDITVNQILHLYALLYMCLTIKDVA